MFDMEPVVTRVRDIPLAPLADLLLKHGLHLQLIEHDPIPGSYWGETEAGLVANTLYARPDTPVHSVLHEGCHWICMDEARRHGLHTDAKGDDVEEAGVCYLQALLADQLPAYSHTQLFADMDAWGYHFRLGSTRAWFEQDAEDARHWLQKHHLIDEQERPLMRRRDS